MSDIARLLVIIILLVVGVSAYFLVLHALFSARLVRTKVIAQTMPGRSFGIGLVNFLFFSVIAMVLLAVAENAGAFFKAVLSIPAVIILAFLAIVLSFGLAGMSNLIGERILPELPVWKQMLWGTVCLTLACALPLVGWFLLLPYTGLIGFGSVILGGFRRDNKS
jgi:hypothetical protein